MEQPQKRPALVDGMTLKDIYPAGRHWGIEIPRKTLVDMIDDSVHEFPDKIFTTFNGARLTYKEAGSLIDRATRGLQDMDVRPGTKVGLHLNNTPFYSIMFFAVLKAGGVVVNLGPGDKQKDLEDKVRDSDTQFIVTMNVPELAGKAAVLVDKGLVRNAIVCPIGRMLPAKDMMRARVGKIVLPLLISALSSAGRENQAASFRKLLQTARNATHEPRHEKFVSFNRLVDHSGKPKPVLIGPDDVALLQYTGGTTSLKPKAAIHSHTGLYANGCQKEAFHGSLPEEKPDAATLRRGNERLISIVPLTHIFGEMVGHLMGVRLGFEMIPVADGRDIPGDLDAMKKYGATLGPGVPALQEKLIEEDAKNPRHLSEFKCLITGGTASPPALRQAFDQMVGRPHATLEGYGSTEVLVAGCQYSKGGGQAPDSGYWPYPGVSLRVTDPDCPGNVLNEGEAGELQMKGPQIMLGYWRDPVETAKVFTEDLWLRTGDIAIIENGRFRIVDRLKDIIKRNGLTVSPRKIEEAINAHPSVAESCVIGIAAGTTETIKAFIRAKPGMEAPSLKALQGFLKAGDELKNYEMPDDMEVWDELPKTSKFEPDKKTLRAYEAAKSGPPAPPVQRI